MKKFKKGFDIVDGYTGVWRTVGGRRIFIRNGESLDVAMQRSGKFGNKKSNIIEYEEEFRQLVKSDNPSIIMQEGYEIKNNQNEIIEAEWFKDVFNTKVELLKASNITGERTPDSMLNDKIICEFKGCSSQRSVEDQMRSAKKQLISYGAITGNGAVYLKITSNLDFNVAYDRAIKEANYHFDFPFILIIRNNIKYCVKYYEPKK